MIVFPNRTNDWKNTHTHTQSHTHTRSFLNGCKFKTSQHTKEWQQRLFCFSWSVQSTLLNMTACKFNDYCLALSEWGRVAASPSHFSLSKRSAISQLLLKYESGFETSWLVFCHSRFEERDCKVWLLSFRPSSVRNTGCALPAVRIYFIFEDIFAPTFFTQKLNVFFFFAFKMI